MKNDVTSWSVVAVATLLAAAPSAQTRPAGEPEDMAERDQRPVVLRGCLKSWDGSSTGVGRTPSGTAVQFVLTNVEHGAGILPPGPSGSPSIGTPPASRPQVAHDTYDVRAAASALDLAQHLDRQVEVTGTLEIVPPHGEQRSAAMPGPPEAPAVEPPSTSPPAGVPGPTTGNSVPPLQLQRVTATAVKMLATSCP